MSRIKLFPLIGAVILLLGIGCTSDPIIPSGGIQLPPPVQDPGVTNQCENGIISFYHQVLPIMVSACAYSGCHDAETAEYGIVLDSYRNIIKEVTPGDPNDSELYESITESDRDDIMPPPPASPLTSTQILIIRQWIEQGAKETDCGVPCDPTQTSFVANILPLIQDYCIGCHSSSRTDGGVNLEDYNHILPYVLDGQLMGTIRHDALFAVMPPSGSKISECRITQIQSWIDEGAQNN